MIAKKLHRDVRRDGKADGGENVFFSHCCKWCPDEMRWSKLGKFVARRKDTNSREFKDNVQSDCV
jgi:hypothetical protein